MILSFFLAIITQSCFLFFLFFFLIFNFQIFIDILNVLFHFFFFFFLFFSINFFFNFFFHTSKLDEVAKKIFHFKQNLNLNKE